MIALAGSSGGGRFGLRALHGMTATVLLAAAVAGCASQQVRMAEQFAREGNWDAAVLLYQRETTKRPDDVRLKAKLDDAKVQAAKVHHQRGRDFLAQRASGPAVDAFKQAVTLDPAQVEYRASLAEGLKSKEAEERYASGVQLLKAEKYAEGVEQLQKALALDPQLTVAKTAIDEAAERQRRLHGTEDLTLTSTQPITLRFQNAKLKDVFDLLSKTSGVNFLFDRDIRDDSITIFVKNVSFYDALNLVLTTNSLFVKRVGQDTLLILPKTKQKIDQYQDLMIRTFYMSNGKAKDMVNLLRTMLETRRIIVNEDLNTIVIRDTPEKIRLAEKVIEANDRQPSEVTFEVEVLEISKNYNLKYGYNFFQGNQTGFSSTLGLSSGSITLDKLQNLSSADLLVTLPSVLVNFIKLDSDARTLANPKIRVVDNKTAKINIGDKVPILLSTTSVGTVSSTTTGAPTTTTSTEFKDVGVQVSVKPNVHLNNDVTMELKLDVTSLGDFDQRVNQYRFGTRITETTINVRDGETVVIGGLIRDEDRVSVNKIPWLGDLPVFGKLFSSTEKGKVNTDVVLTITPRVIHGLVAPDSGVQSFWSGTEESYSTQPLFSATQPVSQPGPSVEPNLSPAPSPPLSTPVPPPPVPGAPFPGSPQPSGPLPPPPPPIPQE